jgi:hypothetical protein
MGFSTQDVIRGLFGVDTTPNENPLITTIGTTAEKLVNNNPRRMSLLIINLSANNVYVGLKPDVSATKGMLVAANGGSLSLTYDKDFQLVTNELWIVGAAAGLSIYTLENNIYRGF